MKPPIKPELQYLNSPARHAPVMLPAHLDISQQAYLESRAKAMLRLHDQLIDLWPSGKCRELGKELLVEMELEDSDPNIQLDLVRRLLEALVRA